MSMNYEHLFVNGFRIGAPTEPCWCLHRVKIHPDWPFAPVKVRRKWWLFGPLVDNHGTQVTHYTTPECWRVPV